MNTILYFMIISSPVNSPVPQINFEKEAPLIQKYCIDLEILDNREKVWILANKNRYEDDVNALRDRYFNLIGAPRLITNKNFHPLYVINKKIESNRLYAKYLRDRIELELDRFHILKEAIQENDELYLIYDTLRDSQEFDEKNVFQKYIYQRRLSLKKLKELIGEENFNSGTLPYSVPIWRFNEIK